MKVEATRAFSSYCCGKAMKRMDTLDSLLFQLEQYGEKHDRNKNTEEKLRNISREMGQFYQF